jgi:hypothetical protein
MAKKIVKGVGSVISAVASPFGLLGKAAGSLLDGKNEAAAPAPAAAPTATMPLPDDDAAKRARKRATAARLRAGGRSSTILTDSTETLGG